MEIFRVIICGNNFMDAEMDDYHFFSKKKKIQIVLYLEWGIFSIGWSLVQQIFFLENFCYKIAKVVNYNLLYVPQIKWIGHMKNKYKDKVFKPAKIVL